MFCLILQCLAEFYLLTDITLNVRDISTDFCRETQNFQRHEASHGISAIAKLLVHRTAIRGANGVDDDDDDDSGGGGFGGFCIN